VGAGLGGTRASATITVTSIFLSAPGSPQQASPIGEVVTFMAIATMLIGRLSRR
jgi:hypothetical protein